MSKPAARTDDDSRRAHIARMVKDNPNIPIGNVSRDVNGRDAGHLLDDLIKDGTITCTGDGRLR